MSGKSNTENEYKELEVVSIRLVKEPSLKSDKTIISSSDATEVVKDFIKEFDRELVCVLNVATTGKPINMNVVSIGTLTSALVSPREVFKGAILSNAAGFILFHCHPSGSPEPSSEDIDLTSRLNEAAKLMDIKLVDHIIVGCGSGEYLSMKAEGFLDNPFEQLRNKSDWER